jgi:hypothetical protein
MSIFMSSSINRTQKNESELEIETTEIKILDIKSRRYHIDERDDYIKERIKSWSRSNFKDENLWKQFRHDFVDWNEVRFRLTTQKAQRELRAYLRLHDVWVRREREIVITKTLANTMKKETQTSWTEKEIMINTESFDFDVIRHLRETNFERNSRDYSWQVSSRSRSRRAFSRSQYLSRSREKSRSRESSFRDRSVEERAFQQASMRQLSRVINSKKFSQTIIFIFISIKNSENISIIIFRNFNNITKFLQWFIIFIIIEKRLHSSFRKKVDVISIISFFKILSVISIIVAIL